jgi:profilin
LPIEGEPALLALLDSLTAREAIPEVQLQLLATNIRLDVTKLFFQFHRNFTLFLRTCNVDYVTSQSTDCNELECNASIIFTVTEEEHSQQQQPQTTMSWQTYVDEQIVPVCQAGGAILDHDGNVWAIKSGFQLKHDEGKKIVAHFSNPGEVFNTGITIGGNKYLGISSNESSIYGRKGPDGCVLVKTAQTILIGVYNEHTQPGIAANAMEKLGDYLKSNGY